MRDRLIELLKDGHSQYIRKISGKSMYEEIADHLLENGVIVQPCKVGDKVYKVVCTNRGAFCGVTDFSCDKCPYENRQVIEGVVRAFMVVNGIRLKVGFDTYVDYFCEDEIYYTKEEAEKALKGGER